MRRQKNAQMIAARAGIKIIFRRLVTRWISMVGSVSERIRTRLAKVDIRDGQDKIILMVFTCGISMMTYTEIGFSGAACLIANFERSS